MDESDRDQILTIEELRSLRDRMGAEATAPRATAAPATSPPASAPRAAPSAVDTAVPDPPAAIPMQPRADPWEDLRRQAKAQRRWTRPLIAAGCLALAGGAITALVIIARSGSVTPPAPEVSRPALPPPAVSAPAMTVPAPVTIPSAAPEPSALPPVPVVPPPSPPADGAGPREDTVPAPRATSRRNVPAPTNARPVPPGVPADQRSQGPAVDRAGAPRTQPAPSCTTGCTEPSRTPTSWNPTAPS